MQEESSSAVASSANKDAYLAKLEAKHEERKVEKSRRKEQAALSLDPTENANVFWQVVLCFF